MGTAERIAEILKNEYGIENIGQLHEEIKKLGLIDISPFCATVRK